MSSNEARTRQELIDPALASAGWNVNNAAQVGIEIPVDGYDATPWNGVTDYCLYQPNGQIIAVVEAKRQTRETTKKSGIVALPALGRWPTFFR